jgi:hypothetical protein
MQRFWFVATMALACVSVTEPARACMISAALDLNDIKYADVVLVGRVSKYEIVLDQEFRQKRLANPNLSPDLRKFYEGQNGILSDYARFNVQVEEVLAGKAPKTVSVTWDNSTFGEPEEMAAGPFLIALRQPRSKMPPLRGPSATILPSREQDTLTVLQAPCSEPFIFQSTGKEALAIRKLLGAQTR